MIKIEGVVVGEYDLVFLSYHITNNCVVPWQQVIYNKSLANYCHGDYTLRKAVSV